MEIILARPRGFCAGVVRAVKVVELALAKYGPPVYVKHPIVHNQHVVDRLAALGAVTVESVNQVPEGATVVFSAHGSPPRDFELARQRGLTVIDGTCPLVTKVHNEVRKYAREGRVVAIVGHRDHVEVRGTLGHSPEALVIDPDRPLPQELAGPWLSPVAVVSQTTLSQDDVGPAVRRIQQASPDAIVRNDICYATTNRQEAVKRLAGQVELVLVVGSPTSSNCQRLVEVARRTGRPSFLIQGPDDLAGPEEWAEARRVGVTSGASTPEELVQAVIDRLEPSRVIELDGPVEDIDFVLPKELRHG